MAQGELGRLFYTLGIDDNDFNKKLKSAQDILRTFDTNSQKLLNLKIRVDSNLNTDAIRALAELTKQTNAKANADAKAALAAQRLSAATLNQAKTDEVRTRSASQSAIASQRLATEAERTAAAHQRLENASKRASSNQDALRKNVEFTNKTFLSQRVLAYQLANALGTTFSLYAVGAFVKKLAEVRGEFELQQVAIRAIIRDKEAADKIFGQVKSLAVESPFQFKELIGYTKQLAAFSIETDKLFDTTKRLADVSAGLGVDMNRIVLAYGQVKAATVLRGQELRQFTEAGIPLVDKLAEKFSKLEGKTVSAGDVFERISNRMVSFKDVDEIFKDLTSSGGMFFEMQKKQADTLYGKISNLKDAYQLMLNNIGEANDGLLKGGVDAISWLIKNWQSVSNVLKSVIAAYGAYKTVSLIVNTVDTVRNKILKEYKVLAIANVTATETMSRSQLVAAARTNVLTGSFKRLWDAMKANAVGLVVAGIAALGVALYNAYQSAHKLENDLKNIFSEAGSEAKASIISMDSLLARLKKANMYSQERADIIAEINNKYGDYLPSLAKESDSYDTIANSVKGATDAIYENARAKAYSESQSKIEETLADKLNKATQKAMSAFKSQTWIGKDAFALSDDSAQDVVSKIFDAIKRNADKGNKARPAIDVIKKTLEGALKGVGIKYDPSMATDRYADLTDAAMKYAAALKEAKDAERTAAASSEILGGQHSILKIKLDALAAGYKIKMDLAKKGIIDSNAEVRAAKIENAERGVNIWYLQRQIQLYKELGQFKQAGIAESKLKSIVEGTYFISKFNAELSSLKGFSISLIDKTKLKEEGKSSSEIIESIISEYNSLKETQESYESAPSLYRKEDVAYNKEKLRLYTLIKEQILGIKDKSNIKAQKEQEDAYTKSIQVRIDLIKKAKQQYEELSKAYGKSTAESVIKDRYKLELPNLQLEGSKYKDQFTKAISDLKGHSSKQAADLRVSINKDIKDIEQNGMMKPFEDAIKAFDRFVEQNKDKFDIYQKIYEITGNEKEAIKIAFNVDLESGDVADVLKNNVVNEIQKLKDQKQFDINFDVNYENIVKNLDNLPEKVAPYVQQVTDYIKEKQTQALIDDTRLLKEAETYRQRIAAIDTKWDAVVLRARQEGNKQLEDAAEKHRKTEKAEANKEFTDKFAEETGFFDRLFARAKDISDKTLKMNIGNIKELASYVSGYSKEVPTFDGLTPEKAELMKGNNALLQELYDHLNDLQEYADKKKDPFSQIFEGLKGFKDAKRYIKEATEATDENTKRIKTGQASIAREKGMQTLVKGAYQAAEGLQFVADTMEKLAEASGSEKLKEASAQFSSWSSTVSATAQGFQSGGPWGGLASGVTNMIGQTIDAFAQNKAEEASLIQSRTDFVNKMKLLDLELQSTDYESVFGVKSIGKASEAYKLAQKALDEYTATVDKKMTEPGKEKEYKNIGAVVYGGFLGGTKKELTNEFKVLMAAYKKGYTELQGLAIKTKDKSGWANFWGSKDQYKALKDYAPELWGSDGVFSVEKAKAFLATDSKINDAQKKQIQNVIDLKEAYDKNMEIVRQDISDTFGVLGSSVTDSLAESIMSGVDAWSEFTKAGSTSLETLGKKMAYELFFSKKFSNLQKQLEETYGTGQTEEVASQQMAILSDFFSNIKGDMSNAKAWMEEWKKKAAESGFDIWSVSTKAAGLQGEIKGIKEDTAQLLASLLNAVRADVSVQNIHLTDIKGILSSTQGSIATSLAYLAKIDANTYDLLMAFRSVIGGRGSQGDGIRVWA